MALVGALQGSALCALVEWWPDDPQRAAWFAAAGFLVSVSALVVHMAHTGRDASRLAALALGIGAAFAGVTLWVAGQLPAEGAPFAGDAWRVTSWLPASAVALFVLGPFVQIFQSTGRLHFPYSELYQASWNNFFVAGMGALFAGALWTVLFLWMRLFDLIGIEVFEDLFTDEWFAYPVTGGALAYGLAAGRESERILATLRGLTQSLFRALLPLVAGGTLAFLLSLPFTGLAPLFATQRAAAILLAWVAAFALLLNAVYLDGTTPPPYARTLRLLAESGVLALPLLAAIAGYALQLRTAQYGLTPERFVAFVSAGQRGTERRAVRGGHLVEHPAQEGPQPHAAILAGRHRRRRIRGSDSRRQQQQTDGDAPAFLPSARRRPTPRTQVPHAGTSSPTSPGCAYACEIGPRDGGAGRWGGGRGRSRWCGP